MWLFHLANNFYWKLLAHISTSTNEKPKETYFVNIGASLVLCNIMHPTTNYQHRNIVKREKAQWTKKKTTKIAYDRQNGKSYDAWQSRRRSLHVQLYMQKACKRMENCMQIAFEKIYYVFSIGGHTIWKMSEKENESQDPTWRIFHTSCCLMRVQPLLLYFRPSFSTFRATIAICSAAQRSSIRSQSKLQIAFIDPIVDKKQYFLFCFQYDKLVLVQINLFICKLE